jgi:hypothetical protein
MKIFFLLLYVITTNCNISLLEYNINTQIMKTSAFQNLLDLKIPPKLKTSKTLTCRKDVLKLRMILTKTGAVNILI